MQATYINTIFAVCSISSAKMSVLFLYYRIFGRNRTFRLSVIVVAITCIVWFMAFVILAVAICIPTRAAWDPSVSGKCVNVALFVKIGEPINGIQDLIIVAMPLFVIKNLHLSRSKKISVSMVFLLGLL